MLKLILSITLIFSFNSVFAMEPYIRHAPGINLADLLKIEPRLMSMVATVAEFCKQNNVKFVVTSIIRTKERNLQVGSVSVTHVEGRAVDFSILTKWGWNKKLLDKLVRVVEDKHGEYGLYGKNKKQKVILIHNAGSGNHAHLQVISRYLYSYQLNQQLRNSLYGI
jgi:hypothetical protein